MVCYVIGFWPRAQLSTLLCFENIKLPLCYAISQYTLPLNSLLRRSQNANGVSPIYYTSNWWL